MTNQSELNVDFIDQQIVFILNSFQRYSEFDLDSILKSIAYPFVFLFICYSTIIELLTESTIILPEFYSPKPIQSPLFLINEDLQKLTVKNLRQFKSFPKSYRKQDMINALLITM